MIFSFYPCGHCFFTSLGVKPLTGVLQSASSVTTKQSINESWGGASPARRTQHDIYIYLVSPVSPYLAGQPNTAKKGQRQRAHPPCIMPPYHTRFIFVLLALEFTVGIGAPPQAETHSTWPRNFSALYVLLFQERSDNILPHIIPYSDFIPSAYSAYVHTYMHASYSSSTPYITMCSLFSGRQYILYS